MQVNDDGWGELLPPDEPPRNVIHLSDHIGMNERPFAPVDGDDVGLSPAGKPSPRAVDYSTVEWPTAYDFFDEGAVAPRRWIYATHYLRSFVSVLASAGGIGKTSMQIVEALAIATGRPLLGEAVIEQCNVWIINLEDPMEEMQRRILAAMRHYHITPDEVRGRLFVDAGRDFRLKFATQTRDGIVPNEALVKHLLARIPERGIGAVFIDPFVGAHEVNENDNGAVNAVVAEIRRVADETACAFGLVHHIRKGNGEDADIDSVRGAGSLIGAARAARVINRMSLDEASRLGIDPSDARLIFRVDDGKVNLAPPAEKTLWRKMQGVKIANGEWVGVATEYALPDLFEGISAKDAMAVQKAIGNAAATFPLRHNSQAKAWAGHEIGKILGIDTAEKDGKKRVTAILKKWIDTDVLRIEQEHDDAKGRDVPVVVVGAWISHQEINQ